MTVNWIKAGMMFAEFKDACRQIDERSNEVQTMHMQNAWQSLLNGDTTGRDIGCDRALDAMDATAAAKMAAWYRIGEKHGISRTQARQILAKAWN